MSFEEKLGSLVRQLTAETLTGQVKWEDTADEDSFRLVLKHGLIRLERYTTDDSEELHYKLTILNAENKVVEGYNPADYDEIASLRELWECARRSARNVDKVLDSLLKELGATS